MLHVQINLSEGGYHRPELCDANPYYMGLQGLLTSSLSTFLAAFRSNGDLARGGQALQGLAIIVWGVQVEKGRLGHGQGQGL